MDKLTAEQIDSMEAGPELDALVAEWVMGWRRYVGYWPDGSHNLFSPETAEKFGYELAPPYSPPGKNWSITTHHYSTDIAAAWEVMDAMTAKGYSVAMQFLSPKEPQMVRIYRIGGLHIAATYAATVMEGICKAALKATLAT